MLPLLPLFDLSNRFFIIQDRDIIEQVLAAANLRNQPPIVVLEDTKEQDTHSTGGDKLLRKEEEREGERLHTASNTEGCLYTTPESASTKVTDNQVNKDLQQTERQQPIPPPSTIINKTPIASPTGTPRVIIAPETIPPLEEWRDKMMLELKEEMKEETAAAAAAENNRDNHSNGTEGSGEQGEDNQSEGAETKHSGQRSKKDPVLLDSPLDSFNYASTECGAKILAANEKAQVSSS